MNHEPEISLEDTQPRPAVKASRHTPPQPAMQTGPDPEPGRRGCANPLLMITIGLSLIFFFAATVGFAAWAGWRDGTVARKTQNAVALVGTLNKNVTLAYNDIANQNYEFALERCRYVVTVQPFKPNQGAVNCISTAEAQLSATPTPTITPTSAPTATPTPTVGPTFDPATGTSKEYFDRAQNAIRNDDYETAMAWLEALRGKDASYRPADVDALLVKTYVALGNAYLSKNELSQMVVVIKKALAITPDLQDSTNWPVTLEATELYLSMKAQVIAQDYVQADRTAQIFMSKYPVFQDDGKALACKAFVNANDSASSTKFKC